MSAGSFGYGGDSQETDDIDNIKQLPRPPGLALDHGSLHPFGCHRAVQQQQIWCHDCQQHQSVTDMTLSVKSISKYHYHSTSHILYSFINDDNYSQLPNRPANCFSSNNLLRDCIGITFGYQAANGSSYNSKYSDSNFDSTLSSSESINKQHYVKLCAD